MRWPYDSKADNKLKSVFLLSDPDIEEDEAANRQWQFQRILGKGGFGIVGLWKKYDDNNTEIDSCVIKAWKPRGASEYEILPGVAPEAVYQYQLNRMADGENTVKVRRYKNYGNFDSPHRFYLELCPHLDLFDLLHRYCAWDQWLPELFLWHKFLALARVADMERGGNPWKTITPTGERNAVPASSFLLHLDLKPANVFLGVPAQAAPGDEFNEIYPQIKVGDFGLVRLCNVAEAENPRDLSRLGTRDQLPPEQTLYSAEWDRPLNGQRNAQTDGRRDKRKCRSAVMNSQDGFGLKHTSSHNTWTLGKIMHDLAFLKDQDKLQPNKPPPRSSPPSKPPPNWPPNQHKLLNRADIDARQRPRAGTPAADAYKVARKWKLLDGIR